jgi:predicted LPLAT superfamily acyltransferase
MLAQRYADSLEQRLRTAPYNWFNFYPYWTDEAASD